MLNATTTALFSQTGAATTLAGAPQTAQTFLPAFLQSTFMTLACEFGDRTFFIAALLAMRHPRTGVWAGAQAAVMLTTALSAAVSRLLPALVAHRAMNAVACTLFCLFGVSQLFAGLQQRAASDCTNGELQEAESDVKTHATRQEEQQTSGGDGTKRRPRSVAATQLLGHAFCTAFSMTLAAEIGDRSQFATIALAASKHVGGVVLGGVLGHAACTAIAVVGGRFLSSRISQSTVSLLAGSTFLALSLLGVWSVA